MAGEHDSQGTEESRRVGQSIIAYWYLKSRIIINGLFAGRWQGARSSWHEAPRLNHQRCLVRRPTLRLLPPNQLEAPRNVLENRVVFKLMGAECLYRSIDGSLSFGSWRWLGSSLCAAPPWRLLRCGRGCGGPGARWGTREPGWGYPGGTAFPGWKEGVRGRVRTSPVCPKDRKCGKAQSDWPRPPSHHDRRVFRQS